jgi:hypothetical protein
MKTLMQILKYRTVRTAAVGYLWGVVDALHAPVVEAVTATVGSEWIEVGNGAVGLALLALTAYYRNNPKSDLKLGSLGNVAIKPKSTLYGE